MITIIDYGMGNLGSVQNALHKLGYNSEISSEPGKVMGASKVILPGVGAFEDAMANLTGKGLADALKEVAAREVPLLGICLGMQLFCEVSEENGVHQGLNLVPGRVTRFQLPPVTRCAYGVESSRNRLLTAGCLRVSTPIAISILCTLTMLIPGSPNGWEPTVSTATILYAPWSTITCSQPSFIPRNPGNWA